MPQEMVCEPPHPQAPGAANERAARLVRISIAVAALGLALYCLRVGNGRAASVLLFWISSLYVFPSASVMQQLRRKHYVMVAVLAVAIIQIGVGLFGLADRVASMSSLVFFGVMLALGSGGNLLHVRAKASAAGSVLRWLLCVASLASGAVWLWLELRGT